MTRERCVLPSQGSEGGGEYRGSGLDLLKCIIIQKAGGSVGLPCFQVQKRGHLSGGGRQFLSVTVNKCYCLMLNVKQK